MGRRKIEIQPLTNDRNRTVTFVKRKAGLFKKAHELAVLCEVDLAVIIIGNNNKVYEFSSVDTSELLNFYQQNKLRAQESKSPENYSSYKKKRRLSDKLQKKDASARPDMPEDDDESDYSDSPEPSSKRAKKAEILPTFNQLYSKGDGGPTHKREDSGSHRPVLRVQIPSDAKENENGSVAVPKDSARTITAIDASSPRPVTTGPEERKFPSYLPAINTKNNNDSRRPTLPVPISKSQTSSPASATAPPLPGNMFVMQSPSASGNPNYPSGLLPTPVLNQVFNQYNGGQAQDGPKRPLLYSNIPYTGDQTPMSGLPSRYVNDMFPSPSTFYAQQDWDQRQTGQNQAQQGQAQSSPDQNHNHNQNNQQQGGARLQPQISMDSNNQLNSGQQNQSPGSNMTPVHGLPQYFMGMLPTGITPTTSASTAGLGSMPVSNNGKILSPLHYMPTGSFNKK